MASLNSEPSYRGRVEAKTERWLTPKEAGNLVGFSSAFIRREIVMKELPAQWVPSRRTGKGGRWRIHVDDVRVYALKLGLWR